MTETAGERHKQLGKVNAERISTLLLFGNGVEWRRMRLHQPASQPVSHLWISRGHCRMNDGRKKSTMLMCISLTIKFMFINSVCFLPLSISTFRWLLVCQRTGSDCCSSGAGILSQTHIPIVLDLHALFICLAAFRCAVRRSGLWILPHCGCGDGGGNKDISNRLRLIIFFLARVFCLSRGTLDIRRWIWQCGVEVGGTGKMASNFCGEHRVWCVTEKKTYFSYR